MDQNQLDHAKRIVAAVQHRHLPERAAAIAIETALTESNLRMYANENVPESLHLPHEAVGSDHKSVGLFQQQVGIWGTAAELMDAENSCALFLNALSRTDWTELANWVACQRVQNSAYDGNPRKANHNSSEYGGNYHARDDEATALAHQLWGDRPGPLTVEPPVAPKKYFVDTFADAPVFETLTSTEPSGVLKKGTSYVFGKRLGREVRVGADFNHFWLQTDPDTGSGHWVSAYYLSRWGNDVAKDNAGTVLPNV